MPAQGGNNVTVAALSTRLSDEAPRAAKIIGRSSANAAAVPRYEIQIGQSVLHDIPVDEILDFVSPQDLHIFEHTNFIRENAERDRRMLAAALYRAQGYRRGRGGKMRSVSDSSDSSSDSDSSMKDYPSAANVPTVELGRHGRPRPEYGQFYLKRGTRGRGRGRGALSDRPPPSTSVSASEGPAPATRGRGRGRPRGSRSNGLNRQSSALLEATSALRLDEPAKRQRRHSPPAYDSFRARATRRSSSADPPPAPLPRPPSAKKADKPPVELVSISTIKVAPDDDMSDSSSVVSSSSSLASSAYESSRKRNGDTASQEPSDEPEEFEIEAIVSHHLSDPATHPPELGKKPVMLYQVRWTGYEQTTWEPVSSFGDQKPVKEYWARLKSKPGGIK